MSYSVEAIFNMHKIKFSTLDEKLLPVINGNKDNTGKVRIFINLEMVFKYLFNREMETFLIECRDDDDVTKMIISNIINLGQHYRLYFAKMKIPNEVYLYWNYNPKNKGYNNRKMIPNYRESYDKNLSNISDFPYMRKILLSSYNTLKYLVKYVNQVYLITSDVVESSVIPFVFYRDQDDTDKIMNLIVSDNVYDYQYVNHDFTILNPKRNSCITRDNVLSALEDKYKRKSLPKLPISYIPSLISILKDSHRDIDKMKHCTVTTLIESIIKGIDELVITENTTSLDMISNIVCEEDREHFQNNYKSINIPMQYSEISSTDRFNIFNQVEDKYDDISLYDLNDRFFKHHLLMTIDTKSQEIKSNFK